MSLLTSVNVGNPDQPYYIENIGSAALPCIKGTSLGAVRVGDPANGVVIRGDTQANANIIYGGQANGGSLTIGNSIASLNNVVLTDGATTVNTPITVAGGFGVITQGDVSVGGNLLLANGGTSGKSISGYWNASVATAGGGAVPNPAGLTPGVYAVIFIGNGAGNEQAQPSGIFNWSGTAWSGNAASFAFTAGVPNCAICPVAGGATLNIGGAGIPATGNVFYKKLLN